MIRNGEQFQKFERDLARKDKVDVRRNFKIVDAMYYEAVELKIFPIKNPLEGLETDIKVAMVVNNVQKPSYKNSERIK